MESKEVEQKDVPIWVRMDTPPAVFEGRKTNKRHIEEKRKKRFESL